MGERVRWGWVRVVMIAPAAHTKERSQSTFTHSLAMYQHWGDRDGGRKTI